MRNIAATIVLALCTGCIAGAMQQQLRVTAGAHTGCPPEQVQVLSNAAGIARVRICEAAHLCRWRSQYGGNDVVLMATVGTWQCEPTDDSRWVENRDVVAKGSF